MSFLKSIFGESVQSSSEKKAINWIQLTSLSQLYEVADNSKHIPSIIFKHSTRCSISRMALKQFENEYDLDTQVTAYFLDLLSHRDISAEIATRFNVSHESPQLILIKDGKAIYDVSHGDIDATALKSRLQ